MNRRVYISTLALGRDWIRQMRDAGEVPEGVCLELGGGMSRDDALWLFAEAARHHSAGMGSSFLLHNYFPPPSDPFVINLASPNDKIRNRSIEFCKIGLRNCRAIVSPFYSVHSGMAVDPRPEALGRPIPQGEAIPIAEAQAIFRDSVANLVGTAKELGVRLLLENHVLASFNAPSGKNFLLLLCGLEDFENFDRDFPWQEVGILLDVGHLKVSASTLGFDPHRAIHAVRHRIGALHLHDNDGTTDMHQAFGNDAWFLGELPNMHPDAVFIVESGRNPAQTINEMCGLLKSLPQNPDEQ
jgi:sugar phosphate isomerase/epimerase